MAGDDELERRLRKLTVEHAETRRLALRLDDDCKEIREDLRTIRREQAARFDAIDDRLDEHAGLLQEHTARFDAVDRQLQEHSLRFDSVDSVLRSLHQLVGQVLDRLPEDRNG